MNYEPQTADAVRDAVRGVVADMRARERALWGGEPSRLGCFAAALMLDGYVSRLDEAVGDAPPPRGAPSRPRPETAAYYTPPAALDVVAAHRPLDGVFASPPFSAEAVAALREANSRAAGERPGCLAFAAGCVCGAVVALVARLILEALR